MPTANPALSPPPSLPLLPLPSGLRRSVQARPTGCTAWPGRVRLRRRPDARGLTSSEALPGRARSAGRPEYPPRSDARSIACDIASSAPFALPIPPQDRPADARRSCGLPARARPPAARNLPEQAAIRDWKHPRRPESSAPLPCAPSVPEIAPGAAWFRPCPRFQPPSDKPARRLRSARLPRQYGRAPDKARRSAAALGRLFSIPPGLRLASARTVQ